MRALPVRILIVKLSSLGDVVHAMPAVQDLRLALPGVHIDWVVESAFAPLAMRCKGVQRVIACDLRRWRKSLWSTQTRREWAVFKAQLQETAYDLVIDLQGLSKSALVSWLARTTPKGLRVGLAHQTEGSGFEAPARWVADLAVTMDPRVHAVQRSRTVCAAALGAVTPAAVAPLSRGPLELGPLEFGLAIGDAGVAAPAPAGLDGNPFAPRRPIVALVHGTSRADKEWPLEHWVALGQRLNHSGFAVALAQGNAAERQTSERIASELADAWVWPTMGLDALTDTMARCAGVIGVDSGLSHIAVALGLPHVQIYNFDTAWRTGPLAERLKAAKQVSVFASPHPDLDTVWQAWEALDTPVLCR